MSNKFQFSATDISVLQNMATIQQNVVLYSDKFYVRSNSDSLVAIYRPTEKYEFDRFGIYELSSFLQVLKAMKSPTIEVGEKNILIKECNSKTTYFHSPIELLKYFQTIKGNTIDPFDSPSNRFRIENNFDKATCELDFVFSAEKLTMLLKMSSILPAQFVFFETTEEGIRVTAGNELESSSNNWELMIKPEDITKNELLKVMKVKVEELKVINDDFRVQVCSQGITKWSAANIDLHYFIGAQGV
jgi:hypothetical protein